MPNGFPLCEAGDCTFGCVAGYKPCGDGCIPAAECCTAADCKPDPTACEGTPSCEAGTCVFAPAADDTPCGVDLICCGRICIDSTTAENCGACGNACADDGNPCTISFCDETGHCATRNTPPGVNCGDGNICNGTEVCNGAGVCVPGAPPDGGPCQTCLAATQNCEADPARDGDPCGAGGHICDAGSCVCPSGTRDRGGTCRECCVDDHCPADRPDCFDGACVCRGSGLQCASSPQCCPGNACFGGFCCTLRDEPCVTGEQCCGGGCDFDSDRGGSFCG